MEIKVNIDEAKILELAQATSVEELPRAVYYQVKKEAQEQAVKEIKEKLIEKPYYGGADRLYSEVSNALWKNIETQVKDFVEKKFDETGIQAIIDRHFDKVFTEWIEKRVYERLEAVKKDVFIGSYGELDAEREAEQQAHQDEIRAIEESI